MGFTIIGPDRFLGSGHPGPSDNDRPSHLGLIESTDGAQTWTSRSLSGEGDLHTMEAKHGQVYGYDSQSRQVMMVSTDTKSWDRRARMGSCRRGGFARQRRQRRFDKHRDDVRTRYRELLT